MSRCSTPRCASCPRSSPTTRWAGTCRASRAIVLKAGKPTADVFKVKGDHILLAVNNEKQFGAAVARHRAARISPRTRAFATGRRRIANDAGAPRDHRGGLPSDNDKTWEERLTKADVPCARRLGIAEIVHHPQLAHRDVMQHVETRFGPTDPGRFRLQACAWRRQHRQPAGHAGEHSEEILAEAGYGEAEIAEMRRDAVI